VIRHITCSADAYISTRVIDGATVMTGNTGQAGSLDLYKLYGQSRTIVSGSSQPNVELTRLLTSFDASWLLTASAAGKIDVNHESFKATLVMRDAYGGQPSPDNLVISVAPLSRSFTEGYGRDIVFLSDNDAANWLSSSAGMAWHVTGCGLMGFAPASCDYYTGSVDGSLVFNQTLRDGTSDLCVDITRAVRGVLVGTLPELSFRVSLSDAEEADNLSYFVKRFSSRHAYDASKRPHVRIEWNSATTDDTLLAITDAPVTLSTAFYHGGTLTNVSSGSVVISGSSCMLLTLYSGSWSSSYAASQVSGASGRVVGTYGATVTLSSDDPIIAAHLVSSGSFITSLRWSSLGGRTLRDTETVTFKTADDGESLSIGRLSVSFLNLRSRYRDCDLISVKLTTFDPVKVSASFVKRPIKAPNTPVSNLHVGVIDALTSRVVVRPQASTLSTLTSLTSTGHEWEIHASCMAPGGSYRLQSYVVDGDNITPIGDPSAPFAVDA